MTSLQGKVVFITGAARGIGAEVARRLHNKGAKLVLTDLSKSELAVMGAELGGDDRLLTVVADVRDLPAMQAAAEDGRRTIRRHRRRRGQRRHRPATGLRAEGRTRRRFRRVVGTSICWVTSTRVRGDVARADRPPRLRIDRLVACRVRGAARDGALQHVEGG
ncbi:short chain dehydrogenase [Mycobacterium tuberculosis 94_M4241A]|nr:short chain dehydrogenase [Mycobacterium tuberculosis 94_M4241A]